MPFTEMSTKIVDEPYQSNYQNVYYKGALINMCLDIIIREQVPEQVNIAYGATKLAFGKDYIASFSFSSSTDDSLISVCLQVKTLLPLEK